MANYFVKNNGDDSKDGLSDANAWRTLDKVNNVIFFPNDNIYFNRGDIWNGQLNIYSSGAKGNNITFTSYSSSDNFSNGPSTKQRPKFDGVTNIENWKDGGSWILYDNPLTSNIWCISYPDERQIGRIFIDGADQLKAINTDTINDKYTYYHNNSNNLLYIYSETNPADTFTTFQTGAIRNGTIDLRSSSYITIDDLEVTGSTASIYTLGIYTGAIGIIIRNCNLGKYAGGAIFIDSLDSDDGEIYNNICDSAYSGPATYNRQRAIAINDMITLRDGVKNWLVHDNTIIDCSHAGIYIVNSSGNEVYDNEIYSSLSYSRGIGISGDKIGSCTDNKFHHNYIHHTTIQSQLNGDNNEFYYNIFTDVHTGTAGKSDITYPSGAAKAISMAKWTGIVSQNNKFYYNIIAFCDESGITLGANAETTGHEIRNNIIYNCGNNSLNNNPYGFYYANSVNTNANIIIDNIIYQSGSPSNYSDVCYRGRPYTVSEFNTVATNDDTIKNNRKLEEPIANFPDAGTYEFLFDNGNEIMDLKTTVIRPEATATDFEEGFLAKVPIPLIDDPKDPSKMIPEFDSFDKWFSEWLSRQSFRAYKHGKEKLAQTNAVIDKNVIRAGEVQIKVNK